MTGGTPRQQRWFFGIAAAVFAVGLGWPLLAADGPPCWEDEVIAWDGDSHSACVPLDDLLDPARTVTFGELVAELGEATE